MSSGPGLVESLGRHVGRERGERSNTSWSVCHTKKIQRLVVQLVFVNDVSNLVSQILTLELGFAGQV